MSTNMNQPSNESLLQELCFAAGELGYYLAAEGDYTRETPDRTKAAARFYALKKEAEIRGVYDPLLVSKYLP